jgi:phosphatidylinositol 4-kinase
LILGSQVGPGGSTSPVAQISVVYTFVTNVFIYTGNWIKRELFLYADRTGDADQESTVFLACGLIYLNFTPSERWAEQRTTFRSSPVLTIFWILSLLFVLGAPFMPNSPSAAIPYYVVPALGTSMLGIGTVYWVIWAKLLPLMGFHIQHEIVQMPDGSERVKYKVSPATWSSSPELGDMDKANSDTASKTEEETATKIGASAFALVIAE